MSGSAESRRPQDVQRLALRATRHAGARRVEIRGHARHTAHCATRETSKFAGMLTVLDIIHLIQYHYRTASYDDAAADVETFKLELLRGMPHPHSTDTGTQRNNRH